MTWGPASGHEKSVNSQLPTYVISGSINAEDTENTEAELEKREAEADWRRGPSMGRPARRPTVCEPSPGETKPEVGLYDYLNDDPDRCMVSDARSRWYVSSKPSTHSKEISAMTVA